MIMHKLVPKLARTFESIVWRTMISFSRKIKTHGIIVSNITSKQSTTSNETARIISDALVFVASISPKLFSRIKLYLPVIAVADIPKRQEYLFEYHPEIPACMVSLSVFPDIPTQKSVIEVADILVDAATYAFIWKKSSNSQAFIENYPRLHKRQMAHWKTVVSTGA